MASVAAVLAGVLMCGQTAVCLDAARPPTETKKIWKIKTLDYSVPEVPKKAVHDHVHEPEPAPAPELSRLDWWEAVADCEGSGNWGLVTTGNGYWFVLQFHPETWLAYGGTQAELDAGVAPSKARLIEVAERVYAGQGPGAWPNCP